MPTTEEWVEGGGLRAGVVSPAGEAGKFQIGRVLTISVGHAIHDTYTAFLPPLLPIFISDLSLSTAEAGLLTVFVQGPSLLQPLIGHLADRVSLRYLVILAPAVTAIAMSLLGAVPTYAVLALLLVAAGISSAGLHAVGPVMAGRLSGLHLGRGMGFWMVGGELGRTLGPIVIVTALRLLTPRGVPWVMVGGLLTSAVLFLWLRDVPGRPTEIRPGLPWWRALRRMGPLLLPLTGIIAARAFTIAALTTYLPTFLNQEGADLWLAGASLSILEAAGVVGALFGGALSDRLGRRTILFASMLATPLLTFLFLAVGGWGRFPLLLALGFTALAVTPVIMALTQESYPDNRALANGMYMSLSFVLHSGVVVVMGALADWVGMRAAFVVSAVIPLLGLPLIGLLPGKRAS